MAPDADAGLKLTSPFYLHPSDHPGLQICPIVLKGDNYNEWVTSIRNALVAKRKIGFIDGTVKEPAPTAPEYEHWLPVNSMLVGWIVQSIDPSLRSSITYFSTVKQLWDDLQQRFSVGNGPRILQLRTEITLCRQHGRPISEYFGTLKKLWDDLSTYVPMITCECTGCKCGLHGKLTAARDDERTHQFLMGLDHDSYGTLRSNIMAQDPLPSLNRVYQLVIQEERLKSVVNNRPQDQVALAARPMTSGVSTSYVDKKSLSCTHCGGTGHDNTTCFKIHGYPDWWYEKNGANRPANEGRNTSSTATRGGTSSRGGRGRGRGQSNSAQSSLVSTSSHAAAAQPTEQDRLAIGSSLTSDQWTSMLQMLKAMNASSPSANTQGMSLHWILDTGASYHMTSKVDSLRSVTTIPPILISLPDGSVVEARQAGTLHLGTVAIPNVLFIPSLTCNLLSCARLTKVLGCSVLLTPNICILQDISTKTVIGVGEQRGDVYWLRSVEPGNGVCHAATSSTNLWHRRLGHPSFSVLNYLPMLSIPKSTTSQPCDVCFKAKQTRSPFVSNSDSASDLFELVHCDLWGPYRHLSSTGASSFLTIVDDKSRSVWVYLLSSKSDTTTVFINFCAMVCTQFNKTVRVVRSDNGKEFKPLIPYFVTNGMSFEPACLYTPQQNGRVERKHRHLLNVARALRFQAGLPIDFWGECVLTACYLINRTPTALLQGKTPYEILYNRLPNYNYIRMFGCLCYASRLPKPSDKFEPRGRKCIFVGYPKGQRGWRLFDVESKEYFVNRDVTFFEDQFPYRSNESDVHHSEPNTIPPCPNIAQFDTEPISHSPTPDIQQTTSDERGSTSTSDPPTRQSVRDRRPPAKLNDYVCGTVRQIDSSRDSSHSDAPSSGTPYPIAAYVTCANFSAGHTRFLAAVTNGYEPRSYSEAALSSHWRDAMDSEIQALESNKTWTLTSLPAGKKSIGCKWVYRIKYKADGSIERYKARLVVLGNRQVEGIDYNETFAPVAKMVSVRVFLSVAAIKGWELHQMDVHNAFLHGDLNEEVYMTPPPGYPTPRGQVCKLQKSLYGLRQAPRNWFFKLASALKAFGFRQSYADYSLFTLNRNGLSLYVLVYVDDMIIAGNDSALIATFKTYLQSCFHMKDLGVLKYFLGIEIARSSKGLFLSQRKYTLDILSETGMLGAKPCDFPLEQNHRLATSTSPLFENPDQYRRLVGKLIYLTITRPELSYSVHILAQFMQKPLIDHWHAALRVLSYLKSHPGQGLLLAASSDLRLTAYCDSDWAACPTTRRSLTGYFVCLGDSPVSWKTKKQPTVSRSSAEAEYRSMASVTSELLWLKSLLRSLGVNHSAPIRLHCDSQAALHIASNPVFHERTKHIEIDCHFVRDQVTSDVISLAYIPTAQQPADIFTKALGRHQFQTLLSKLGILDLHAPT